MVPFMFIPRALAWGSSSIPMCFYPTLITEFAYSCHRRGKQVRLICMLCMLAAERNQGRGACALRLV